MINSTCLVNRKIATACREINQVIAACDTDSVFLGAAADTSGEGARAGGDNVSDSF